MKVLILHQHFNTPERGGALRSYYLAKALIDQGHETIVITGSNEKTYRKEFYQGIEVLYLPIAYDNSFGFASRSLSFLKYIIRSVNTARAIPQIDICYAISVPLTVGLAAMWLKRKVKVPYIFEVGDLWPDAPIQLGLIKNYLFSSLLYYFEKIIYRDAKSIVALSQPIKQAIESKVSGKEIHIIPNMADCDFYQPVQKDSHLEEKFNTKEKFVVSYIGTIGFANGLDYFIECANASRKSELSIHFIVCGDGAMLPHLKVAVEKLGLKNISFTGFVNQKQVKEVMNVTDAVFVSYKNVEILQTGSPNKYFDGLAAGKLIVVNFEGWIKNEIQNGSCGIYSDCREPSDFINKIGPFVIDNHKTREFQLAARSLAESSYNRQKISEQFVNIFNS